MLYFVSTPIGNLKDITLRALEVLKSVDVIACEDTRNSLKLLNHYDIHKKLIAYHKFNENNSSDGIIALLNEGKDVAVISDAGMPVISDPGQTLIEKLKQNNLEYTVVPGANAGLCALLLSGLDSTKFTFVGFVPDDKKQREKLLKEVKEYKSTLIFYVAPHDVTKIVKQLYESFGTRKACLVNEITKMFEKTFDFELSQSFEFDAKGEYVLVVEGNKQEEQNDFASMSIKEHLLYYINLGEDKNSAIKKVAKQRNLPKNEVYQVATQI
ncbi:MAG: 16S rRNA (cytidine(1402)-2'-O)-methyltransferase [Clostridiales bacterium]|nr:16S rRNA (cytidine(1402)-2'-O)-methyltransferase [Clostridiales bacterium]